MAPRKQDQERLEKDYEMFLRDVEEDEELRAGLALYKAERKEKGGGNVMEDVQDEEGEDESDDDGPRIPMEQLIDEMEEMELEDTEMT